MLQKHRKLFCLCCKLVPVYTCPPTWLTGLAELALSKHMDAVKRNEHTITQTIKLTKHVVKEHTSINQSCTRCIERTRQYRATITYNLQ